MLGVKNLHERPFYDKVYFLKKEIQEDVTGGNETEEGNKDTYNDLPPLTVNIIN